MPSANITYVGILALNEWTLITYKKKDTEERQNGGATYVHLLRNHSQKCHTGNKIAIILEMSE